MSRKCTVCGKETRQYYRSKEGGLICNECRNPNIVCDICGREFRSTTLYSSHYRVAHPSPQRARQTSWENGRHLAAARGTRSGGGRALDRSALQDSALDSPKGVAFWLYLSSIFQEEWPMKSFAEFIDMDAEALLIEQVKCLNHLSGMVECERREAIQERSNVLAVLIAAKLAYSCSAEMYDAFSMWLDVPPRAPEGVQLRLTEGD